MKNQEYVLKRQYTEETASCHKTEYYKHWKKLIIKLSGQHLIIK